MQDILDIITQTGKLSADAKKNISDWLTEEKFIGYRPEVEKLIQAESWQTLEDGFFRVLPFGTGGRRGTVGVGSNRINRVTIGEACQALSEYLHELYAGDLDKGVAIAYDSRNTSVELSNYAAQVLAGNGIKTFLYEGVRSTPELSFTVRHLGCLAGIVISASHNPSPDNGIKIYWRDGGQLVPPHDYELLQRCENLPRIVSGDFDDLVKTGEIVIIGGREDEAYYQAVLDQSQDQQFRGAVVAYSPLHGAGMSSVYPTLTKAGFKVELLESQSNYDGNFTNVTNNIPNPELAAANDKVAEYAVQQGCDIAITNDPDADRICVLVRHEGEMVQLDGNQMAALLCDYLLSCKQSKGELGNKDFIAKTIVTTDLLGSIAEKYGVNIRGKLLVGFKYIGELIHLYVDKGDERFLFGGEESYGALVGSYCRDKDAAGAAILAAEYASKLKTDGKTLLDALDELHIQHGYYKELLESIGFSGAAGFHVMKKFMEMLREDSPKLIGGQSVIKVCDYLAGEEIPGKVEDVLSFELSEDGRDRVTVRPSGTEPKLKIYVQIREDVSSDSLEASRTRGNDKAKAVMSSMLELVNRFNETHA